MSKKGIVLTLVLIFICVAVAGCGGGDKKSAGGADTVYKIKVADGFPAAHIFTVNGLNFFMKNVEEKSKGRIKFEHYPGGQLGKQADMLELVKTGVTDMAFVGPTYMSGKLPLSNIFDLPGMYSSATIGAEVYLDLTQNVLYDLEYKPNKIQPVFAIVYSPSDICNTKKEIRKPSDLKGMSIRVPGLMAEKAVMHMGAAAVNILPQEMYEATMRGTVDGLILPLESFNSYKMQELVKYTTKGMDITGFAGSYCFNENFWKKLPEDLQKLLLEEGRTASIHLGSHLEKVNNDSAKEFEKAGMVISYLTPEEKKAFYDETEFIAEQWVKEMEAKKLPGKKVMDTCRELVAKYSKK